MKLSLIIPGSSFKLSVSQSVAGTFYVDAIPASGAYNRTLPNGTIITSRVRT